MGKLLLFTTVVMISFNLKGFSQDPTFVENIAKGDAFYNDNNFLMAAASYNAGFRNKQGYASSNYLLLSSYCWDKAGFPDSSITNLLRLVYSFNYADTNELNSYFKKSSLKNTHNFKIIQERTLKNLRVKNLSFIPELAHLFDSVYQVDQSTRSLSGKTDKNIVLLDDSQTRNMKLVDSIYKKYGWLAYSQVGYNGSMAQFLVIQHSDLKTQMKWLPLVKNAVDAAVMPPDNLALITDRVLVQSGKKQLYGTQLKYDAIRKTYVSFPIKDPANVDLRRTQLGMVKMYLYLEAYNN